MAEAAQRSRAGLALAWRLARQIRVGAIGCEVALTLRPRIALNACMLRFQPFLLVELPVALVSGRRGAPRRTAKHGLHVEVCEQFHVLAKLERLLRVPQALGLFLCGAADVIGAYQGAQPENAHPTGQRLLQARAPAVQGSAYVRHYSSAAGADCAVVLHESDHPRLGKRR